MKRLFSPWRSKYIETFKSKKKSKGCLFCDIAKQKSDEKRYVVWRGKYCYAVLNLYPYNSGHVMIVPYQHTPTFEKLSREECSEVMETAQRLMRALKKMSKPQGFNFGSNIGRGAGAGIDQHVHFHIVPRWDGDTNFMPVLSDTKMISEELKKTWKELTALMNKRKK